MLTRSHVHTFTPLTEVLWIQVDIFLEVDARGRALRVGMVVHDHPAYSTNQLLLFSQTQCMARDSQEIWSPLSANNQASRCPVAVVGPQFHFFIDWKFQEKRLLMFDVCGCYLLFDGILVIIWQRVWSWKIWNNIWQKLGRQILEQKVWRKSTRHVMAH